MKIKKLKNYPNRQLKISMSSKIYSYDEVYAASLEYFKGDELAARVWSSKYALKDSDGNIYELTPDDMHHRIAKEIARIENKYPNPMGEDEIFSLLKDFRYIVPQGSPMAGIGNNFQVGSLSNCFVIGLDGHPDSYGGIIRIDEEQVQLMKRRGGVGHDLSHIRPKGSAVLNSIPEKNTGLGTFPCIVHDFIPDIGCVYLFSHRRGKRRGGVGHDLSHIRPKGSAVKNSALTSTGLVPFMERYSNSTREVAQDGRRGALMMTVSIKHPDAESFIDAKMTEGKVTGANVSVKILYRFIATRRQLS